MRGTRRRMNTHRFNTNQLRYTKVFKDFDGEVRSKIADDIKRSPGVLL